MLAALQMQPITFCNSAGLAKIASLHSNTHADRCGLVGHDMGLTTKKCRLIVWVCHGPAVGAKGKSFNQAVNLGYHLWVFSTPAL